MGTIQPQEDIKLPANVQKRLDDVKDSITIGESEIKRLGGIINATKYEVDQLVNQRAELLRDIKDLESRSTDAVGILKKFKEQTVKAEKLKEKLEASNNETIKSIENREKDLTIAENNVKEKANELKKREEKLHKSEVDLAVAETRFDEKKKKLDSALKSL